MLAPKASKELNTLALKPSIPLFHFISTIWDKDWLADCTSPLAWSKGRGLISLIEPSPISDLRQTLAFSPSTTAAFMLPTTSEEPLPRYHQQRRPPAAGKSSLKTRYCSHFPFRGVLMKGCCFSAPVLCGTHQQSRQDFASTKRAAAPFKSSRPFYYN